MRSGLVSKCSSRGPWTGFRSGSGPIGAGRRVDRLKAIAAAAGRRGGEAMAGENLAEENRAEDRAVELAAASR